jgi:hypothetical protein
VEEDVVVVVTEVEDEEEFDSDIFEDIFSDSEIDEQEIISFLNEYYLIYNSRLPKSEIY